MGRRKPRREYNKKVHPSKRRRREVHKCTQCDKKFPKFEDIKIHFLETHTKWKKDESSVEKRPTNISTENESTSSEIKASNDLAPTTNQKEAGNSSDDDFCQETLLSNPTSNSKTRKVQIIFECSWKDCGKCFKSFGDLDIHRKTQHVDKSSKKCTKCDAEFDSFEILKQHFLQTHTKWRKEDELIESKDNEDVTIVEEKAEDPKADTTKEKINENYTKIVVNTKKVDKCLQVNTITTDPNVKGFLIDNSVETIKAKQSVHDVDDAVVDDPKNTYIIFSENAIVNNKNSAFYIVKTKPNIDNSTSSNQDSSIYELLTNDRAPFGAININETSCISSYSENITTDPTPTADCFENLINDLRPSTTNVKPVVNTTPELVNCMPYERNTTSSDSNEIPVANNIIPDKTNITSVEINNTSDVAKTKPEVKGITSDVGKITSMLKNFLPVMRNIKSVPTVKPALNKTRRKDRCFCFNCLHSTNSGFSKVMFHMCGNCGQQFIKKSNYYAHVRTHDPFKIYYCPLKCGQRFENAGKLIAHINSHPFVEYNFCQMCQKGFQLLSDLKRHASLYHVRKSPEITVNQPAKFGAQITNNNTKIAKHAYSKEEDIIEITDDISEVEDNDAQPTTGISGEDYSSSEENIMDDITNVPSLVEDEVSDDISEVEDNDAQPNTGISDEDYSSSEENITNDITNAPGLVEDEVSDDISEVEDNDAQPNTRISDEDYSSSEESITNDITNVPGLVEDEVCLELEENFVNNIPTDPLSGFEDKPIPEIILNGEEESVGVVPKRIRDLKADNMESKPVQSIRIEQSMKSITNHNIVNTRENIEDMSLVQIKREYEMRHNTKTMKESIEPFPNEIVNIDEESMEHTPLVEIKREDECIKPIPEQITEESIEFMPRKRMKQEISINLVPGQTIHVADANFVMRSFNRNRYLQVQLERLPFFV